MVDSLPSINFGFDELRDRMAKFTAKFDNFIEQGRKRVLEERNQFRMNVVEFREDQRMKKKEVEIITLSTSTHQQNLAKEEAETNEMETAIAELAAQRDSHQATKENLKTQIAEIQEQIEARLEAQRAHANHLENQSRNNIPELEFWHTSLCMRIEGAGKENYLKIIFTHVDEKDWNKEASFIFDLSGRDYRVLHSRPRLEPEKVDDVVEKLNEKRQLASALKMMRQLFIEHFKSA